MSDDLSLERALIEELIGLPVERTKVIFDATVWYFTSSPSLHLTIGPVSIPAGDSFSRGVYCHNHYAIRGNGWLFVNCQTATATWPPCSFPEFIEKLRDPKIREACELKPLEEM